MKTAAEPNRALVVLVLIVCTSAGCGSSSTEPESTAASTGAAASASPAATGTSTEAIVLTAADLAALQRGVEKEIDAVRAAQEQSASATTAQARGQAIQAAFETATIPLGAAAAGLSLERYRAVRETVFKVLQTLDFQDKIDGPLSMDLARADAATKERLSRDAYADLPEASAAVLRAHIDEILPVWIRYVTLTAVAG
jgi:hypothetical protein